MAYKNEEDKKKYAKKYREENKEKIHEYYMQNREFRLEYCKEYHKNHLDEAKKRHIKRSEKFKKEHGFSENSYIQQEIRTKILNLLGNKCSNPNCLVPGGCTDKRCIQIDHVNGNGHEERKKFNGPNKMYRNMLKEIENGSVDYQLLCANCNWIKKYVNDENKPFNK